MPSPNLLALCAPNGPAVPLTQSSAGVCCNPRQRHASTVHRTYENLDSPPPSSVHASWNSQVLILLALGRAQHHRTFSARLLLHSKLSSRPLVSLKLRCLFLPCGCALDSPFEISSDSFGSGDLRPTPGPISNWPIHLVTQPGHSVKDAAPDVSRWVYDYLRLLTFEFQIFG